MLVPERRLVDRPVVCLEQALRQIVVAHFCIQEAGHLHGEVVVTEELGAAGYVAFEARRAGVRLVVTVVG